MVTAPRAACRGAQAHGDGDSFLVVEKQRWHRSAGPELVATHRAAVRIDGVAELAQAVDVLAYGPAADAEPLRQLRSRPNALHLQQREQAQQARRGLQHPSIVASH